MNPHWTVEIEIEVRDVERTMRMEDKVSEIFEAAGELDFWEGTNELRKRLSDIFRNN